VCVPLLNFNLLISCVSCLYFVFFLRQRIRGDGHNHVCLNNCVHLACAQSRMKSAICVMCLCCNWWSDYFDQKIWQNWILKLFKTICGLSSTMLGICASTNLFKYEDKCLIMLWYCVNMLLFNFIIILNCWEQRKSKGKFSFKFHNLCEW